MVRNVVRQDWRMTSSQFGTGFLHSDEALEGIGACLIAFIELDILRHAGEDIILQTAAPVKQRIAACIYICIPDPRQAVSHVELFLVCERPYSVDRGNGGRVQ